MIWIGLPDDTPSKQLLNAASSYSILSPSTPPSVGQEIMNTSYGEHEQQQNSWPSFDRGFRRSRDSTRLPIRLKEEVVGDLDFPRLSLCLCFCNILVNIPYHVINALLSEDSCLIDLLGYQFIMSFVEQRRWSMRQFGPYQPSACDPW
ncbi:LOW QUALITY PROTEIN: hypothetical protein NC651_015880 [Populus alba x Populus x berolinensis]|nr:LOW QUALITY PROTEIN: hypothetical protein NC651_015880 [Populus alba x Populus x berolinensis]